MREIKFRAWDAKRNEMDMTPILKFQKDGSLYSDVSDLDDYNKCLRNELASNKVRLIKVDLMQYTGLKDKNGAEIYEGDIVNYAKKESWCKGCDNGKIEYDSSPFCKDCGSRIEKKDFIETAKIVYDKASFQLYKELSEETYQSWPIYVAEIYIEWVEVIGNIYENPQLLEGVKLFTT